MNTINIMINSLSHGGAERVVSRLISKFSEERAHKINLILLENEVFYDLPKNVNVILLDTKERSFIMKFLMIPFAALKLIKIIKLRNMTTVQSHLYRANYINIISKLFGSKHNCQIVNTCSVSSQYNSNSIKSILNKSLIRTLYPKADLVICKSYGMLEDLKNFIRKDINSIVIYNPYDIEGIKALSNERIDEFDFKTDIKYIISIGRLYHTKRQKDIIDAFYELNLDNTELIFLGDGTNKPILKELVNDYRINQKVHFLGRVSNPFKFLSRSDIFILASESEGFPNSIIESLICHCPVISSDCVSGPREIIAPETDYTNFIKHGFEICSNGILFKTGDINSLIKAIQFSNEHYDQFEETLKNSEDFIKTISLDLISKDYLNLFYKKKDNE